MSEDDTIQKRKEAAAKLAPNLGKKREELTPEEAMEKRKEAAAKAAPNLGQQADEQTVRDEARERRVAASKAAAANVRPKEAAAEAKSEEKREETAEQESDKWQGLAEEAREDAPAAAVQEYTVQAGDSLWGIADKFYKAGAKWNKIYEANKDVIGDDSSVIRAGQVLKIPNLSE